MQEGKNINFDVDEGNVQRRGLSITVVVKDMGNKTLYGKGNLKRWVFQLQRR
jgi:hypothetical protein